MKSQPSRFLSAFTQPSTRRRVLSERRSQRSRQRSSRLGFIQLQSESLEQRALLAITTYVEPTNAGGFLTVVGEAGDDVFLQKIATPIFSLLAADNSSFINEPSLGLHTDQIGSIDSLDKILITTGVGRTDSNSLPQGYPMSAPFTTTFRLSHRAENFGNQGFSYGNLMDGQFSLIEPDGSKESWHFTNGGGGYGLRIDQGIGVSETPKAGYYYPTSVSISVDPLHADVAPTIDIRWNVSQLPQESLPNLDAFTWYNSQGRREESNVQPSAPRRPFQIELANAAGLGVGPIIPSTFSGVISISGEPFAVEMADSNAYPYTLTFRHLSDAYGGEEAVGKTTGTLRNAALSAVQIRGNLVPDANGFRGLRLATFAIDNNNEVFVPIGQVELVSARYAVASSAGDPMTATIFSGLDLTNALDINLATPGSEISIDSPVRVAASRSSGITLRATTVDLNARVTTASGLFIGGAVGSDARAWQTAAPVAQTVDGKVTEILLPPGLSGAGYNPDKPPIVTIDDPQSVTAVASITSLINGAVSSINVRPGGGGTGYTAAPSVTVSRPDNPNGRTATATAVLQGTSVVSVLVTDGGSGYAAPPTITFSSGAGVGALADASIVGSIGQVRLLNAGYGYDPKQPVTVTFNTAAGAGGTGAQGEAIVAPDGSISQITVTNPGTGYALDKTTIVISQPPTNPNKARATATAIVDPVTTRITGFTIAIDNQGSGYGNIPKVTVAAPVFASAARGATANVVNNQVDSILLPSFGGGYGYAVAPSVFIDRPTLADGQQATAEAVLDSEGRITAINVTNSGSGYDPNHAPVVSIDGLTPLAVAETVRFNAGIGASWYEIHTDDDRHTAVPRSTVSVTATATLAADEYGVNPASTLFVDAVDGDVIIAGSVFATAQTYLLQSLPASQSLLPFRFSTVNPGSGVQTGVIRGGTLAITLANDLPTPQNDATAFNDVSIQTNVDSLRVRAARRNGTPINNPFPYVLSVAELDSVSVDAVAASTFPILLSAEKGSMLFTATLATAGGIQIFVPYGGFTMTAPIATTNGQISVTAADINLLNSLAVTAADQNETVEDVVLNAIDGDIRLNGGGVRAINKIVLNQKNKTLGGNRSPSVPASITPDPILDGQTVSKTVVFEDDFIYDGAAVDIGITHQSVGDLSVSLIAPDGTRIRLVDRNAYGVNFTGTVFSSDTTATTAPQRISQGSAPYTGSFLPLDSLASLYGRHARGTWTLEVQDNSYNRRIGTLDSFSVRLHDKSGFGSGQIVGTSRLTGDTLEINSEGSVGDPTKLPGDPGFYVTTDVNVVDARVGGAFSLNDIGSVRINALQPGGPVSLRVEGVDPEIDSSGKTITPALLASMTDVTVIDISTPRGSADIRVNTAGTLTVGNLQNLSLDASIRNAINSAGKVRVFPMQAAGDVKIRTLGGASGGDIVLLDAPLAGSSDLKARYAVTDQINNAKYDKRQPGVYAATLSSVGNSSLAAILPPGSSISPGDRVLVAGGSVDVGSQANGLYVVVSLGGTGTPWKLVRAPEADTANELLPHSIVAVTDGGFAGNSFRIDYDPSQVYAATPISVVPITTTTNIGSNDPNDLLTYVVSTPDGKNTSAGSFGKMIGLRQANNNSQSPSNINQKSDFRFSTGITGPIKLEQELPAIVKAFAIDGSRRYPQALSASAFPIVLDGSRIKLSRSNTAVKPSTTVDAFTFAATSGDPLDATKAASLANVTIGGFSQGSAVDIQGAPSILVNSVKLGVDSVGKRFVNRYGVLVAGVGANTASGTTIRDSFIVGASIAGVSVQGGANGVTLVGNTIGDKSADNVIGVEMTSGANRVGVAGATVSTVVVPTVNGSRSMQVPTTVPFSTLFIGQKVSGGGITTGTTIAGINGQTIMLSKPMIVTGKNNVTFESPKKNIVQNNLDGIVLLGGQSTVANTKVINNTFDGIRIDGGNHFVGTSPKVSVVSNEIWGNGRWGLSIKSSTQAASRVTGNYFSSTASGVVTRNLAGDVAINNVAVASSTGLAPVSPNTIDKFGNQHARLGGVSLTVPAASRFGWRPTN